MYQLERLSILDFKKWFKKWNQKLKSRSHEKERPEKNGLKKNGLKKMESKIKKP